MRLKSFKGLSTGKVKEKEAESGIVIEGTTADQLVRMEKKLTGRKKDLEDATRQIQDLSTLTDDYADDEPIGPHGPLQELTLEDIPDDDDLLELPVDFPQNVEAPVVTKLEVSAAPPQPDSEIKDIIDVAAIDASENEDAEQPGKIDFSDPFSDLFEDDGEDENPLAALIRNLPDVSVEELVDDLTEIKNIIREWQHNR